jgi:mono/diheme cytochrome c family protein
VRPQRPHARVPLPAFGLACAGLLALVVIAGCSQPDAPHLGPDAPTANLDGAALFDAKCSRCHGAGAAGTDHGPSLLDPFYAPSRHPDAAFERALRDGVRAYHWRFGDMPRIGGLTDAEVTAIITYVRDRQRAAGLS